MLKQVFFARLEPMVTRFGPWTIRTCLNMGCFGHQKMGKNGSIIYFSKRDREPFGMLKQEFFCPFSAPSDAFWAMENPEMA